MKDIDYIHSVLRHIENVQENTKLLGEKLVAAGEVEFGVKLIANGLIHDNSKLSGIEWEYLRTDTDKENLSLAISHHNHTNPHHPEYWGGIKNMPRIYVAEMVCDIKARSSEFGTDIRVWVEDVAMKKYGFTKEDKIYKEIFFFLDMICEKPFTTVKTKNKGKNKVSEKV